jgi:Zn-finger nucleic acid-binding protein
MFSIYNNRRGDKNSDMQCPNCSTQMQLMQRYEVDIDYCPSCRGVWLDRGEIDKIAKIQRSYEDQHYNKYHYSEGYDDYYHDYYHNNRWRNRGFFGALFDS